MELWIGALNLGLLYALMAIGVLITFRIQDFPDITVDGSFTTGAATAAVLIISGWNPFLALLIAFLAGSLAGAVTGMIYTGLKINGLLAGILVMIGLYSINLHIMGRSNIPLLKMPGFVDFFNNLNPGMDTEIWLVICLVVIMTLVWMLLSAFFKTDLGITFRITGDNKIMSSASGINVNRMEIFGIAFSNGLVALSGGMVAQYQGFADIGMGIGTVVIGLASVIIGEAILRKDSVVVMVLSAIIGSIVFRFMIAFALYVGMDPIDLKLLTAVFVLLTLFVSKMASGKSNGSASIGKRIGAIAKKPKLVWSTIGAVIVIAVGIWLIRDIGSGPATLDKYYKIGVLQVSDNGLLNVTRDAFSEKMQELGYFDGENCSIRLDNANGDLHTLNNIVDKYIMDDYDLIVTISTPATQAALNKVKDIPIVFATVANPFIIDAGESDTKHLPGITGIYGWVKMDETLELAAEIFKGKLKIGSLWDPAHANSVFNVERLKKAVANNPNVEMEGMTVTSTTEVHDAALALIKEDVDLILLPPDNTVYSAFEAVVKAAMKSKTPIILSDVSRLKDGAFAAYGYDYTSSGHQAAHLVDRILHGESPADIPFEQYKKTELGINLKTAKESGIEVPVSVLARATTFVGIDAVETKEKKKIGIVQFAMEPNVEMCKKGILAALKVNGYEDQKNIDIIYKNANADFAMINSIIQDFIRRDVDIIVPLSTPCVQSAVNLTRGKKKPEVVFTYIFDPYKIGAAETPEKHEPNMTGVACFPPVQEVLGLIKEMFPARKKIGIVWNSSEANSEAVMNKLRPYGRKIGLDIIEQTVTTPSEVLEASRSLANKGAEIFLNAGDNTLNVSFDSFAKVAGDNKIPVFSVDSELIENGAMVCLGPDYTQTGFEGGLYLSRVLNGEKTADIPIHQTERTLLYINKELSDKMGIEINKGILSRADKVIEKKKTEEKKDLALFLFSDNTVLTQTRKGILNEFKKTGYLNDNNIEITDFNAQNEFTMAQSVADDIVRQEFDYIITVSTPALQVMANANTRIPHIFGAVTDPYRMGIAESSKKHRENITGVATFQPVESTIKAIRALLPNAKKIGIVWNPSEACSEACTYKARDAAKKYGFELIESTVSSTSEVLDATKTLIGKDIDAFLTSGDNTVFLAIPTIADLLHKDKIPYFTNDPTDVTGGRGALMGIGADYVTVGEQTAKVAIMVMNGEKPAGIPIQDYVPEKRAVNMKLMEEYGLKLPSELSDNIEKYRD